jgi:hypothetical protein
MALQIDADAIVEVKADMIPSLTGKTGPAKPQSAPAPRPEPKPVRAIEKEPESMEEETRPKERPSNNRKAWWLRGSRSLSRQHLLHHLFVAR